MIYDEVVAQLGINPSKQFTFPTATFSLFGYKERKKLAGNTSRVLREAGFAVRRKGASA
jgi:hypothetical protein